MFSLIITIISIALVVVLAVAAVYYGGNNFTNSGAKADAAKLLSQVQQVSGAIETYKVHHDGAYPNAPQDLVDANYLKSLPAGTDWDFEDDYLVRAVPDQELCVKANKQLGIDLETVPLCTDPAYSGKTVCCELPG